MKRGKRIQKGTYQHHLLTEDQNSFKQSTEAVNALHYAVNELPPVRLSAVYNNAINVCNYEKVRTQKSNACIEGKLAMTQILSKKSSNIVSFCLSGQR